MTVTFGAVYNQRVDLYRTVIEGLAGLDLPLVIVPLGADHFTNAGVAAARRVAAEMEQLPPAAEVVPILETHTRG